MRVKVYFTVSQINLGNYSWQLIRPRPLRPLAAGDKFGCCNALLYTKVEVSSAQPDKFLSCGSFLLDSIVSVHLPARSTCVNLWLLSTENSSPDCCYLNGWMEILFWNVLSTDSFSGAGPRLWLISGLIRAWTGRFAFPAGLIGARRSAQQVAREREEVSTACRPHGLLKHARVQWDSIRLSCKRKGQTYAGERRWTQCFVLSGMRLDW